MKRLFFGLSVDPVVGQSLIRAAKRTLGAELSQALYGEDDLHLTLCFLGSFPKDRLPSLVQAACTNNTATRAANGARERQDLGMRIMVRSIAGLSVAAERTNETEAVAKASADVRRSSAALFSGAPAAAKLPPG